jgi:hypothetical protein
MCSIFYGFYDSHNGKKIFKYACSDEKCSGYEKPKDGIFRDGYNNPLTKVIMKMSQRDIVEITKENQQIKKILIELFDSINNKYPNKDPQKWDCPYFQQLSDLIKYKA